MAVLTSGLVACGGLVAGGAPWTTRSVDQHRVSLALPSNWNVGVPWVMPSSFSYLVASFSNQDLSSPCARGPNSLTCGPPLASLQAGGILVEVYENGSPMWSLSAQPGTPRTVSGLSARVAVESGAQDVCTGLAADETRIENIAHSNTPDNYIEVVICSRGVPDAVGARILASLRVTSGG